MSKYLCMSNNGDYFIDFQNLKNSRNGNLLIIFKYLLQKKRKRYTYIHIYYCISSSESFSRKFQNFNFYEFSINL